MDDCVSAVPLHGVKLQVSLEVTSVEARDGQTIAEPRLHTHPYVHVSSSCVLVLQWLCMCDCVCASCSPVGLCAYLLWRVWEPWSTCSWTDAPSSWREHRLLCHSSGETERSQRRWAIFGVSLCRVCMHACAIYKGATSAHSMSMLYLEGLHCSIFPSVVRSVRTETIF